MAIRLGYFQVSRDTSHRLLIETRGWKSFISQKSSMIFIATVKAELREMLGRTVEFQWCSEQCEIAMGTLMAWSEEYRVHVCTI
jgi:hypothetical protein